MKDKPFYYQDNRALHERKMNEAARLEISRRNIEFILEHQKDSAAELARYLRRCQAELGHVPAQSEILGGDLLALRFGSWVNALEYSGFSVSTGPGCTRRRKKTAKKRPRPPGESRSPRKRKRKRRQKPREALNERRTGQV